ncbi:MAG: flagellar biosynthetic protein FliO [Nitrospirales bacterium]|nr:flagellar biosynthetic protein FliO [Nitrospira sp.]MDR4502284.1 flagellar biosynthetic protein FliO [Nitrospirales bacterium]
MDFADQALKMAGALAVVVTALLSGTYLVKRFLGDSCMSFGKTMVRLLGGLRLGQGKSIMLVEVAGEVLVLGATARDLTLLTRVTEASRVEKLRSHATRSIGAFDLLYAGRWGRSTNETPGIQENHEPANVNLSTPSNIA